MEISFRVLSMPWLVGVDDWLQASYETTEK